MISKMRIIVAAVLVSVGLGVAVAAPVAYAAPADEVQKGVDLASGGGSSKTAEPGDIIETIVRVMLFVIGAISVIMIIVGGIRYTISQGDSGKLTTAKHTIMYSIVGLLVAIFAYAIVSFIVDRFV